MRGLLLLALVAAAVGGGVMLVGRYQTLDACTSLDHRLDEAARPPSSSAPVTPATAEEAVRRLGGELQMDIEDVHAELEPLTPENAVQISTAAAQAVALAARLPNHQVQGKVLSLAVGARVRRLGSARSCRVDRRLLVAP